MKEKKDVTNVIQSASIIQALQQVYDPELPVDICALGLIYGVHVYDEHQVQIVMTLTSPNCPAAELLPSLVEGSVRTVSGVKEVQVTITFDPPYHPSMMSETAKLTLGLL